MNHQRPILMIIGPLLLALAGHAPAADEVIIQGVETPAGQAAGDEPPLVQDLGDGSTDDGGVPDATVDLRDAALQDEQNLGPNAPGYIP